MSGAGRVATRSYLGTVRQIDPAQRSRIRARRRAVPVLLAAAVALTLSAGAAHANCDLVRFLICLSVRPLTSNGLNVSTNAERIR